MTKGIKKQAIFYALTGIAFGLLFPVISTLIAVWQKHKEITFLFILSIQKESTLLWVIDSAPFWLGLFAWFAGVRQDRAIAAMLRAQKMEEILRERNRIIEEDLEAARKVHEHSLPQVPQLKNLEVNYLYLPLESVGGDILDIITLDDNSVSLFIGDVSGHGVSAALINAFTIALIRRNYKVNGKTPSLFLANLHDEIQQLLPDNKFLSCLYANISPGQEGSMLTFTRAGHLSPLIWRHKEQTLTLLNSEGGAIGFERQEEYSEVSVPLHPGDYLFLYTDGLLESKDRSNNPLGLKGFMDIISYACRKDKNINEVIHQVLRHHSVLCPGEEDDKLILGVKVLDIREENKL